MLLEAYRSLPNETGGILLGYWSVSSNAAVVTNVLGPGPAADHRPMSFSPDADFQVGEIARVFNASGGVQTYLGDWHTHPNGRAYLSGRDIATLRTIAEYPEADLPFPLMCVVGLCSRRPEIAIWQYVRRRARRPKVAALRVRTYEHSDHE
jgi:integrative and conjugative element protein (TIGR02256 family)